MNQALRERVIRQLELLPDGAIGQVLERISSLKGQTIRGTPGTTLMKFAGIIRTEDAEQMMQAIEQDCRRIDKEE